MWGYKLSAIGPMAFFAALMILSALVYSPAAVPPRVDFRIMPLVLVYTAVTAFEIKNWKEFLISRHTSQKVTRQNRTPTLQNRCQ